MKISVTTTREKDNLLRTKAEKIAEELNIPYIKNVYKKVITMEKANEKKKTSCKNSAKKL